MKVTPPKIVSSARAARARRKPQLLILTTIAPWEILSSARGARQKKFFHLNQRYALENRQQRARSARKKKIFHMGESDLSEAAWAITFTLALK